MKLKVTWYDDDGFELEPSVGAEEFMAKIVQIDLDSHCFLHGHNPEAPIDGIAFTICPTCEQANLIRQEKKMNLLVTLLAGGSV